MMTASEQAKTDRTQINALWNQAIIEDIRVENQRATIRHSAGFGWKYSRQVGEFGGWYRAAGDREQIVAREQPNSGAWIAFEVSEYGEDERVPTSHPTLCSAMAVFA